nr:alcohol dehydrogenase [Quercus suber]
MTPPPHTLTSYRFDAPSQAYVTQSTLRAVGDDDVLIRTTHSGLCYTDVHAKNKGCGLGHEGVGVVEEVGRAVMHLEVGDRVGWGWLHSARGFAFSDLDQGAFGDIRIINSAFAYLIPQTISSTDAGPFMCAGASVYEALDAAGTKPSDRVGVVGIGGLGHMAILFAKAMGCAVTAISTSNKLNKRDDAFQLGANEYHSLGYPEHALCKTGVPSPGIGNINILLITSNTVPHLERLLPLLARRATIVLMTIQETPITLPYMAFVLPGHRLIASTEASRENHIAMLEFAARHKIKPWIQTFPMTQPGLREAFTQLEEGSMRYRGVLIREAEC